MTASVHLQWTYAPSTSRPITLADIILPRVLERYGLHTPTRTNLQFRTYRASSSPSSTTTSTPIEPIQRYLTIISTLPTAPSQGDDISYLFMDDRGANEKEIVTDVASEKEKESQSGNGQQVDRDRIQVDQPPPLADVVDNGQREAGGGNLIDDGFEIIDVDAAVPSTEGPKVEVTADTAAPPTVTNTKAEPEGATTSTSISQEHKVASSSTSGEKLERQRQRQRYQILAIRPGNNIVPILQALSSPFVLGITKSARVTASTTNSTPIPTPLPGSSLLLTCLSFTYIPSPAPSPSPSDGNGDIRDKSIILKIYILPNPNAQSIFLQAEFTTTNNDTPSESADAVEEDVLKEFLQDCLPSSPSPSGSGSGSGSGIGSSVGEKRYTSDFVNRVGYRKSGKVDTLARSKQNMFTLAKILRQGGFI